MATLLNYSKKRLEPVIKKFGIDEKNDVVFNSIVNNVFPNQTDYQLWALKVVFSHITTLDDIISLKLWADNNPEDISNLSLKNLVSYKTKTGIARLHNEINSLNAYHFVKNFLDCFNTDQKKLLRDEFIVPVSAVPYSALSNRSFAKIHKMVTAFSTLPEHRKAKFITLMSAVRNVEAILTHMQNAIAQSYDWNRDDFMTFLNNNCPTAEICYDENGIVILRLPNFKTAEMLCGKGRTSWCLTRQQSYFRQYTADNGNAQQYALFDFNLKENHELAHVGFSVRPGMGINHAHSTKNQNLMGSGITIDDKQWNITEVLNHHNIPKTAYVRLKRLKMYEWNKLSFVAGLKRVSEDNIKELPDGRLIVEVTDENIFDYIFDHTLINEKSNIGYSHLKMFAVMDFEKDINEENSVILVVYDQDVYGELISSRICNAYGEKINDSNCLCKFGLKNDDFITVDGLDANILLHKYIDTGNIKSAMEILSKSEEVDPNTVFFNNTPAIKAVILGNVDLFNAIIEHSDFNFSMTEGFGEPIAHFILLFMRSTPDIKDYKPYVEMCLNLLNNKNYDKTKKDPTGDTILHTACECGEHALPVIEFLLHDSTIDVNAKNHFGYSPLMVALECRHEEVVSRLLKHPNIEITEEADKIAKIVGIEISPGVEDSLTDRKTTSKYDVTAGDDDYADLFARAFTGID